MSQQISDIEFRNPVTIAGDARGRIIAGSATVRGATVSLDDDKRSVRIAQSDGIVVHVPISNVTSYKVAAASAPAENDEAQANTRRRRNIGAT